MTVPEPEDLEVKPIRGVKPARRKEEHISSLSVNRIEHYLTVEQLIQEFGENGWKQLPDAVMKHYRFIPAKVETDEHHIRVYSGKKDNRVVKIPTPIQPSQREPGICEHWRGYYERQIYERGSLEPYGKRIHKVWADHRPEEHGQLDAPSFRRITGSHL